MTELVDLAQPPQITSAETVDAIVEASKRKQDIPLRREFVQQRSADGKPLPGPLARLVQAGDRRGLLLWLLLLTKASAEPWNAALPAAVWARALGLDLPGSKTARSTISKIWLRLEDQRLVTRGRKDRLADVFLCREDGSGTDYVAPGQVGERYCKIPLALWLEGPQGDLRWYQALSLPELAVILIGRSLSDGYWLPFEYGPEWYGISADTLSRGTAGLEAKGLLQVDRQWKKAPLSVVGHAPDYHYTLQAPLGPIGRLTVRGPRSTTAHRTTVKRKVVVKKASAERQGHTARKSVQSPSAKRTRA